MTEADVKSDRHSLERRLDVPLLLVVNQRLGRDCRWILPQAVHAEGETMRQARPIFVLTVAVACIKET